MKAKYKSVRQQWVESLPEGDRVIDEQYGLATVVFINPQTYQHIDLLCEAKGTHELFWTTNEQVYPPHKVRWKRDTPPKPKPKNVSPKPAGRKPLHVVVNEPEFGIYLYIVDELIPTDWVEYPCVKIYVEEDRRIRLDFLRHYFAKPLTVIHESDDLSQEHLLRLAAAHAARIYRERY